MPDINTREAVNYFFVSASNKVVALQDLYKSLINLYIFNEEGIIKYEARVRATLNYLVNNNQLTRVKRGYYQNPNS